MGGGYWCMAYLEAEYDLEDKKSGLFDNGFHSLINFE